MINKLVQVQAEVGGIKKDAQNAHLRNRYASLEAILSELNPVLNKHGLFLSQQIDAFDGTWYVETLVMDGSDKVSESLRLGKVPVINTKGDAQGLGSAITYARRYGLAAAFGLWQTDDDAEQAIGRPAPEPVQKPKRSYTPQPPPPTAPEVKKEEPATAPEPKPELAVVPPPPAERFGYKNPAHRAMLVRAVKKTGATGDNLTKLRTFFESGEHEKHNVPTNEDQLVDFLKGLLS